MIFSFKNEKISEIYRVYVIINEDTLDYEGK